MVNISSAYLGTELEDSSTVIPNDETLMTLGLENALTDLTPVSELDEQDPISLVEPSLPGHGKPPTAQTPKSELVCSSLALSGEPDAAAVGIPTDAVRPDFGLRLPSFQALGIENPHPDRKDSEMRSKGLSIRPDLVTSSEGTAGMCGARLDNSSCLDTCGPLIRTLSLEGAGQTPSNVQLRSLVIETLTPPEEKIGMLWSHRSASVDKVDELALPIIQSASLQAPSCDLKGHAGTSGETFQSTSTPRIELQRTLSDYKEMSFIESAASSIVRILTSSEQTSSSCLKVLSHALPCPSPRGFAFPAVISALQMNTPGGPLCWINVFHALRKSNLSELPTSPPATPCQSGGGVDYFTSKTFDSAVPVIDYQDSLVSDLPRSPLPVVAPSSIHVSIVERYIPPTSSNEFIEMFKLNGRSLLVDRLMELSPNNGTLLFVYPTLAGGQTFKRDFLGPLLDPVLRMMGTLHNLPTSLISSLGSMPAASSLLDYDTLKGKVEHLCAALGSDKRIMERFSSGSGKFHLESASKETVLLERAIWADHWWVKQEKARIRETVNAYFGKGSQTSELTPMSMTNHLLDNVSRKQYQTGWEPTHGVEVGVFVIRRSA